MDLTNGRLIHALKVANDGHHGQKRKGTDIPYISHPMGVASLVFEFGGNEDEVIAALLHDVLEDGGAEWASIIETSFGDEVLSIVRECSDSEPRANEKKAPWKERKTAYLSSIPKKSSSALLVTASDKLHNLTAIVSDYRECGDELWSRFNTGADDIFWYYSELTTQFQKLGVAPANELRLKCDELQEIVKRRHKPRGEKL